MGRDETRALLFFSARPSCCSSILNVSRIARFGQVILSKSSDISHGDELAKVQRQRFVIHSPRDAKATTTPRSHSATMCTVLSWQQSSLLGGSVFDTSTRSTLLVQTVFLLKGPSRENRIQ